jgi:hypothetical protein
MLIKRGIAKIETVINGEEEAKITEEKEKKKEDKKKEVDNDSN